MVKYTSDEINEVFEFLMDPIDLKGRYLKLTTERITNEDGEINETLLPLVGYQVKVSSDKDHRHDGQLVDCEFYFKNPKGVVTTIETEMCLMVGWNHCNDVKIK